MLMPAVVSVTVTDESSGIKKRKEERVHSFVVNSVMRRESSNDTVDALMVSVQKKIR